MALNNFYFPFTFGEVLNISNAYGNYVYRKNILKFEEKKFDNSFKRYDSQINLNNEILAFNMSQRFKVAQQQASAVKQAFAGVGLTGGTLSDSLENYSDNLKISALTE